MRSTEAPTGAVRIRPTLTRYRSQPKAIIAGVVIRIASSGSMPVAVQSE